MVSFKTATELANLFNDSTPIISIKLKRCMIKLEYLKKGHCPELKTSVKIKILFPGIFISIYQTG